MGDKISEQPRQNAIERSGGPEGAHIGNYPLLVKQALSTQRDQRRRGIDAGYSHSMSHLQRCRCLQGVKFGRGAPSAKMVA
jgi:hypothetical protein